MNKTAFAALSLVAASSAFATPTPSTHNYVLNGSFEQFSGIASNTTWGQTTDVSNWTSLSGDKFEIQVATSFQNAITGSYPSFNPSYDNAHYLELNANRLGAISQTLGTKAGQTYTLSFGYADRSGSNGLSSMNVYWNGILQTFNGSLQNGYSISTDDTAWKTYTVTVTGIGNDTLKFVSQGPTNSISYGSYLDGVSVTAVPEPASYAMLLAGLGVMATITRRRNKAEQV